MAKVIQLHTDNGSSFISRIEKLFNVEISEAHRVMISEPTEGTGALVDIIKQKFYNGIDVENIVLSELPNIDTKELQLLFDELAAREQAARQ